MCSTRYRTGIKVSFNTLSFICELNITKLSSVTDKCGDLTKFGITIGEGVKPNCKGLACFPQCDDPNKMPNFQKLTCIKKRGKQSIVPAGFNLQCVGMYDTSASGEVPVLANHFR